MISSSLNMFKKPETVNRTLEKIGHGHFKKGVKAYQYPLAGQSLFATFKFCLGPAWDTATERAWHRIFSHILREIVRIAVIDEKAGEVVEQKAESRPAVAPRATPQNTPSPVVSQVQEIPASSEPSPAISEVLITTENGTTTNIPTETQP